MYDGYVYSPPPVVVQRPTVYIQATPQPQYWYYCQNPQGYYPYLRSAMPGGLAQRGADAASGAVEAREGTKP